MLRYWRVLLLVVMVLASVFAIGLKFFPYGREGVEVVYVATDSPARGILETGMVITSLGGEPVRGVDDWNARVPGLRGAVELTADGRERALFVNESLGVNVVPLERTNIEFGLDLRGGTRIILAPEGNVTEELMDQVIGVLETRANLFGLQEIKLFPVRDISGEYFIQIEAAGIGSEIVDDLLSRQGEFKARIIKPVEIQEGEGSLVLGSDSFPVTLIGNQTLLVAGGEVAQGESFSVGGVDFEYLNLSAGRFVLLADIFDGDDIELVYTDPQRSGVMPQGEAYVFFFQVLISSEGAERFADVTTGIPKYFDVSSGEEYLDSSLLLYIDGEVVSSLRIAGSLGGQVIQSPQVTGTEPGMEAALEEKLRLQTILKSGALPVPLTTLSVDTISPTLGAGFVDSAVQAALVAGTIVLVIVFLRYRKVRISVPLVLVGISEAVIILGIASTGDQIVWGAALIVNLVIVLAAWSRKYETNVYAWVGAVVIPLTGMLSWTIDLPAIAGMIAVIGTGVDHQIIIADEALKGRRRIFGIKDQLKAAFFIIMGAAATTIFAMLPLIFVGVGLVRGFAITTIVGVLVGILVTRPAYARIVEGVGG